MGSTAHMRPLRNRRARPNGDLAEGKENGPFADGAMVADVEIPRDDDLDIGEDPHASPDFRPEQAQHHVAPAPEQPGAEAEKRMGKAPKDTDKQRPAGPFLGLAVGFDVK